MQALICPPLLIFVGLRRCFMKRTVLESSNFSDTFLRRPHSTLHKRIAEGDHRKLPETCLASRPIFPYQPGLCRPTEYTSARTPPLLTRPISVPSGTAISQSPALRRSKAFSCMVFGIRQFPCHFCKSQKALDFLISDTL